MLGKVLAQGLVQDLIDHGMIYNNDRQLELMLVQGYPLRSSGVQYYPPGKSRIPS